MRAIATELLAERFVSVVGPGGIGKATVAVAAGHALLDAFAGAVRIGDLGAVRDPTLIPSVVASTLGLAVQGGDMLASIVGYAASTKPGNAAR